MGKIVYSRDWGGIALSDEAIRRYAELKGINLYPQTTNDRFGQRVTWWTIPESERADKHPEWWEPWPGKTENEEAEMKKFVLANTFDYRKIMKNDDPHLVQTIIDVAGDDTWWTVHGHRCPVPGIRELAAGTLYRIHWYEGVESVIAKDEHKWIDAQPPKIKIVLEFRLSDEAVEYFCRLKGIVVFPEYGSAGFVKRWWTFPEGERNGMSGWRFEGSSEDIQRRFEFIRDNTFDTYGIEANDPTLVQVCEELGDSANAECSRFTMRELAPGTKYLIKDDDGMQTLITMDSVDWKVAL